MLAPISCKKIENNKRATHYVHSHLNFYMHCDIIIIHLYIDQKCKAAGGGGGGLCQGEGALTKLCQGVLIIHNTNTFELHNIQALLPYYFGQNNLSTPTTIKFMHDDCMTLYL